MINEPIQHDYLNKLCHKMVRVLKVLDTKPDKVTNG